MYQVSKKNYSTKEILNTFLIHTFGMRLNKSLATLTSILGVCYSACLKSQVKVKKYQDYFISRKKTPFQTNYSINGHIIE